MRDGKNVCRTQFCASRILAFWSILHFQVLSSQVTNRDLKEVMTLARINKSISIHCARHSFATIAGELGVPVEVIMQLLGHSNIKITMGYVKVTQPSLTKGMMLMDKL